MARMFGRGNSRAVVFSLVMLVVVALLALTLDAIPDEVAVAATAASLAIPATAVTPSTVTEPTGDFTDYGAKLPVPKIKKNDSPVTFDAGTASITSRTEFSDVLTDANGVHQVTTSESPVNVKVDGSWVPSQTSLNALTGGGYADATHPLHPQFGATADAASIVHVSRDGASLDFQLEGALGVGVQHPVIPFINTGADKVAYPAALPGVNLTYQVTTAGVKESMLLASAPTRGPTYSWLVSDTGGVAPATDRGGNLVFTKGDGTVVFVLPAPIMWDSSSKGGENGGEIQAVKWTFHQVINDNWEIDLTPSQSWLSDPDRVYPVTIDPSINPSADSPIHSFKSDGNYNNGHALVGNNFQSGSSCCNWRAIPHYNYEQLFGNQLTGAYLRVAYYSGQGSGQGDCFNMNIYYAGSYSYNGAAGLMGTMPYCYSAGTQSGDIGANYNQWINSQSSGAMLLLIGDESQWSYRAMNTSMVFNYVGQPTLSSIVGPVNGARYAEQAVLSATASDPTGGGLSYDYQLSTTSNFASIAYDSGRVGPGNFQVPAGQLAANTTYYYRVYVSDWDQSYSTWSPWQTTADSSRYFVTNTPAPAAAQPSVYPTDQTVVSTLSPTFSTGTAAADANGDPEQYQFRIATGSDGNSGAVTTSGWLSQGTTTWSPPTGTLQDGVAYTLQVLTWDGYDATTPPWVTRFRENLRVGDNGPSPTDTEGPVTVNLANGNASLSFSGPTVSTVGGAMGLGFVYNSLIPATKYQGLTASYWNLASGTTSFPLPPTGVPVLSRTDAQVNYTSQSTSPGTPVNATYFEGRWTGFVRVPTTGGPYTFGSNTDDGARLVLNGTQQYSQSVNPAGQLWATSTVAAGSAPQPIEFDFYQATGAWAATLNVKDGAGNVYPVPASWLSTTYQPLPAGWSASAPLAGQSAAWVSETTTATSITLTDSSGLTHTWTQPAGGSGSWTPPVGESGTVALDGSGNVVFTDDDGTIYTFTSQGKVATVTAPADLTKPATPTTQFDPTTGRATSTSDPLSVSGAGTTRTVYYVYSGDSTGADNTTPVNGLYASDGDASHKACQTTVGGSTAVAPAGTLCEVVYPGHVPGAADTTNLYYNSQTAVCTAVNGAYDASCLQLAQITNPGGAISTFQYDTNGRLILIRNPLQNDWLTKNGGSATSTLTATSITYDSYGRAIAVTLPAPDGVTASKQPSKTYGYGNYTGPAGANTSPVPLGAATGTTTVDVAGMATAPIGGNHVLTATFDSSLRQLTSTDGVGLTATQLWNNHDNLVAAVNPQGLESTTLYDSQDRPTDTYGPAPQSCFPANSMTQVGQQNPGTGVCAASSLPVAHSATGYDGGLNGLDVQWFKNATWTGPPAAETVGIGTADGSVNQNWGDASPITNLPADNWSARLTGTISFPATGNYGITLSSDDGATVWINDVRIATSSVGTGSGTFAATGTAGTPQVARIRIDYNQLTQGDNLTLAWTPPGGSSTTVPGSALSPNYSLTTSTSTDDAAPTNVSGVTSTQVPALATTTSYGSNPWLGQPASSVVDPGTGHLNLTSTATYETPGSGFGRQLTSTKPAGAGTTSSNTYYPVPTGGAAQSSYDQIWSLSSAVCSVALGTLQDGMLQKSVAPANSAGVAIETDYIYDYMGRVAATRQTGDTDWSCTTYDSRGRMSGKKYAGNATSSTVRQVTYNYSVNSDPLTTSVKDDTLITGSPNGDVVTATSDLDGNQLSYTDVWGTVTTTSWDPAGEMLSQSSKAAGQTAGVQGWKYDADSRVTEIDKDGAKLETVSYNAVGQATGIALPSSASGGVGNGTSGTFSYDPTTGTQTGLSWTFPASQPGITDQTVLSQSGRVLRDTTTTGSTSYQSQYSYDGAGRLVAATMPHHQLTYGFATSGTCPPGTNTNAGTDGNRTSFTDSLDGGAAWTVAYCYDNADRLIGDTVTNPPTGADPVAGTNLVNTGTSPTLVYDNRGNTTTLADQTLSYDATDRHLTTTLTDGTKITYVRDVTDRIIARTTLVSGVTSTIYYSYNDSADTPDWTLAAIGTGAVLDHNLTLSGGINLDIQSGTTWVYAYSNLHGDDLTTAGQTGTRGSGVSLYDPFGDALDPSTWRIATITADDAGPNTTSQTTASFGWEGSHLRLDEHADTISTVEMGSRQYVPTLGRFLCIDPTAGGNSNDYNYPTDPINNTDLDGNRQRLRRTGNPHPNPVAYYWKDYMGRPVTYRALAVNKVINKHNLGTAAVWLSLHRAYTSYPELDRQGRATSRRIYLTDASKGNCNQFLGLCLPTGDHVTIRIVVDTRKNFDGDQQGIITAYCIGPERCPSWVNRFGRTGP